jgi:hypothetical protein
MENNNNEEQAGPEQRSRVPSFDEYFSMNEQEKDLAIERSVLRLQNRILQIMYLLEIESKPSVKPSHAAQPNDHPRDTQ